MIIKMLNRETAFDIYYYECYNQTGQSNTFKLTFNKRPYYDLCRSQYFYARPWYFFRSIDALLIKCNSIESAPYTIRRYANKEAVMINLDFCE